LNTPISVQILQAWAADPLLIYQDTEQSKEMLHDILKQTFKQSQQISSKGRQVRGQQDLVIGNFKLEQIW